MLRTILGTVGFLSIVITGCAIDTTEERASEESVGETTEAMSRCGYPPRRPRGCTVRCECTEPVNGPFGEDIGDYVCTGGDCVLSPRADCSFELYCD